MAPFLVEREMHDTTLERTPFWITQHARERFIQRSDRKYSKLSEVNNKEREVLSDQLKREVDERREEINCELQIRLFNAKEDRSCLNNSPFMTRYYDKFGYDHRFQFLVDKDFVYVIVFQDGYRKVITCIDAKTHIAGRSGSRPKFRKKKV